MKGNPAIEYQKYVFIDFYNWLNQLLRLDEDDV